VIRLKPFDTATAEGMSKERYRRIALTTATSVLAKGVGLLTMLISVPLTRDYLGGERFGLWMLISSLIAFLGFADFGMGNGLLNAIAEAKGKDDFASAQKSVSSGFFMLAGLGISTLAVFSLIYPFVSWPLLFKVKSELAAQESGPALAVFVFCFAISLPLGVVQRVQLGYQEGFASNLWQMAGSVLGLAGVLLAIQFRAGLPWLVLAMSGMPVVVTLANWFHYFRVTRPTLFPRIAYFDWATSGKLWQTGLVFMFLQVLALNWFCTDNLVIDQMKDLVAVGDYSVVQRLFSITLVAQFLVMPLWPAYGEALARKDYSWVHRTLNRALLFSVLITGALAIPLMVFAQPIVRFWTHAEFVPSYFLMGGCAILNILIILAGNLSSLLVHGEMLKKQVVCYTAGSVAALVLKIILTPRLGVAGVVWGSILGFGILYTPFALRLAYHAVRRPGGGVNQNDEQPNVRPNP